MGLIGISALSSFTILIALVSLVVHDGNETSFFFDFDHRSDMREEPTV